MSKVLLVGLGGCVGSILRYLVVDLTSRLLSAPRLPYGTLVVNVLGCLLIGMLGGVADTRHTLSPEMRSLLFVGLLGGFTTFSAFGYETHALAREGQVLLGLSNVALQVIVGLGAVWIGYALASG